MTNPRPLLVVGEELTTGIVQIQDMLFTATGATAGVILVEWNIAQSSQGSAAIWGKKPRWKRQLESANRSYRLSFQNRWCFRYESSGIPMPCWVTKCSVHRGFYDALREGRFISVYGTTLASLIFQVYLVMHKTIYTLEISQIGDY